MKLSLNWLKEYVDIDIPPEELAHMLTMAGLEVEELEHLGQISEKIIVAKVMSVRNHPRADRLSLCDVDTGSSIVQVVCGAPNVEKGCLTPMALPGAELPGGIKVKESTLRGEKSSGILLAEDELGLTDDHSGIMILPSGLETGIPLIQAMELDDWAIDISLTPNRPDCASVIGVAREVAALTGKEIHLPEIQYEEEGVPLADVTSIDVKDYDGCPRYAAGMIQNVTLKTSPFWMRYRLYVSGTRSKNNIVDISNYVLLETGQPLHTFDYDQLSEHRIVVSRAKEGYKFTTLDEKQRTLNKDHLMICDGEKPVGVAGIMGGLNSEISDSSVNILIESACFDPVTIRRGAKSLGISSEASYRFERGIDIEGVIYALKRALMLSLELAGGAVNKGIIDIYPQKYQSPVIDLRVEKTNRFLGSSIPRDEMIKYLEALQMSVKAGDDDVIVVVPPSYRVDLSREIDLVEEIARMSGYDNIPVTYPAIKPFEKDDIPSLNLHDRACDVLSGIGFSEIITYSFISPDSADLLCADQDSEIRSFVSLMNPLTTEQSVMRTSLLPGLISAVKENIAHGESNLKLFEWGKIYIRDDSSELPIEKIMLSGIMSGSYDSKKWFNELRPVDFYDIKGAAEVLLRSAGPLNYRFEKGKMPEAFDEDSSCCLRSGDRTIGYIGKLKSEVIEKYEIKSGSLYVFEIEIDKLITEISKNSVKYEPYPKYPAVFRDISIIVDKKVESSKILSIILKKGGKLVESVDLFGIYEGRKLGEHKKSLSYRICYRSDRETLDGDLVNDLNEKIIKSIMDKTGGTLSEG